MLNDVVRALKNKYLYASALIVLLVLSRLVLEMIMDGYWEYDYLMFFDMVAGFTGFNPFALLLASAPYACSFYDEYKSGYTRAALLRARPGRYIAGKIMAVSASGAVAIGLPILIVALIGLTLFQPVTPETMEAFGYAWPYHKEFILRYGGLAMLGMKVFFAALYGAVWSLPTLIVSCLAMDRLVAIVLPFVANYAVWILATGTRWSPTRYLFVDYGLLPSMSFVVVMELLYMALFAALAWAAMKWRCAHV